MFTTERFQSSPVSWEKIKEQVIVLEREAFGDQAFTDDVISEDFLDSNSIIFLLKEKELDTVVGFLYAKPIEYAEPARESEKGETAYIWDTVIQKEYRGQHL
jgi:Acetyltransferase (GNAT) family